MRLERIEYPYAVVLELHQNLTRSMMQKGMTSMVLYQSRNSLVPVIQGEHQRFLEHHVSEL